MNSREIVRRTLEFQGPPRVPRQMWAAVSGPQITQIRAEFPEDIRAADYADRSAADLRRFARISFSQRIAGDADSFVLAGKSLSPFGLLLAANDAQSVLGDLLNKPPRLLGEIERIHQGCLRDAMVWAASDVDALVIMDDWGGQKRMMMHPDTWRALFKPLYRDYCRIAHDAGKYVFMHSDGWILEIIEDLIEIGVNALNVQLSCMGVEELGRLFRRRITFWGDIDQRVLSFGSTEDVRSAVEAARKNLWANGGVIAQCEFGPGARYENVREVFLAWNEPQITQME